MQHVEPGVQSNTQSKSRSAKPSAGRGKTAGTSAAKPGKAQSARKQAPAATLAVEAAVIDTRDTTVQQQIAVRAYELWEIQGYPQGQDLTNWHQAEQEIVESLRQAVVSGRATGTASGARSRD